MYVSVARIIKEISYYIRRSSVCSLSSHSDGKRNLFSVNTQKIQANDMVCFRVYKIVNAFLQLVNSDDTSISKKDVIFVVD